MINLCDSTVVLVRIFIKYIPFERLDVLMILSISLTVPVCTAFPVISITSKLAFRLVPFERTCTLPFEGFG